MHTTSASKPCRCGIFGASKVADAIATGTVFFPAVVDFSWFMSYEQKPAALCRQQLLSLIWKVKPMNMIIHILFVIVTSIIFIGGYWRRNSSPWECKYMNPCILLIVYLLFVCLQFVRCQQIRRKCLYFNQYSGRFVSRRNIHIISSMLCRILVYTRVISPCIFICVCYSQLLLVLIVSHISH